MRAGAFYTIVCLQAAFVLNTNSVLASTFRVLVFPHHGSLPIPQGREAVTSNVMVTSLANCDEYLAKMNANQEWVKDGSLIQSATEFSLSSDEMKKKFKDNSRRHECIFFRMWFSV